MQRTLLAAVMAATVLIAAAAPATAMTLHGRILGQPRSDGTYARMPILLATGAEAVLTVPARSGFRTADQGRTAADRLRLGDEVSARVRAVVAGRARARYLKIVRRSSAPAFGALAARLAASSAGAKQAVDEVARIGAAEAGGPQDPAQLRFFLLQLRYQLNLLIAELRGQAGGMERIAGDLNGHAKAGALQDQLGRAAQGARSAATTLEHGVAGLDEFINSIGGLGGGGLPAGQADLVNQLLAAAQQVIAGLVPPGAAPGGSGPPALPGPVSGLPLPS